MDAGIVGWCRIFYQQQAESLLFIEECTVDSLLSIRRHQGSSHVVLREYLICKESREVAGRCAFLCDLFGGGLVHVFFWKEWRCCCFLSASLIDSHHFQTCLV